jgi:hypothetical protein
MHMPQPLRFRIAILCSVLAMSGLAAAQSAPAVPATRSVVDEMPMKDYLGLLQRISPAAYEGATTYAWAHARRCGRPLRTSELRQAISEGDGHPVLMAMIRASHLRDGDGLSRWAERVPCGSRSER